ncbi:MAG: type IV secretion protein Rhs, partial [Flavobacteriaceae bacterium]|nr:type IV secretion protein Rhs [Flavobacteriaceae bacterium]
AAKPESWKTTTNDIKAIRTRSGHTIEFNDAKGAESITITDINSNRIYIDTANNNITVNANETMTFNAKNININASEEININAGTNMTTKVIEDHSISSKNSTEMVEEDKVLSAKEILENAEKVRIESTHKNMELVCSKQVDIQADDKIKLF